MNPYRAHFYKLIRDPLFYVGIIATALLCASKWLQHFHGSDVRSDIDVTLYFSTVTKMIAIAGALPFAANFAGEWKSRVTINCVSRCDASRYAVSNVVVCFLSSVATVFVGMMLYAGVLSFFIPVYVENGNSMDLLELTLLGNERYSLPWIYIIYRILPFAASCGMWSVMGMMVTAFFPNKFVGICTPFVASYVIERISTNFPGPFNLYFVSLGVLPWNNIWMQLFYCLGLFVVLSIIFGIVFVIAVKRRVQNEVA